MLLSCCKEVNGIKSAVFLMGIQDEPLTATPLQNSLLELYGLVSIAFIGEYWVGPNQAIKMTMEDWKKGACFLA